MAFSLADISSGPTLLPPRVLVLGVEGVGKSTFAAGAPNPVFAPIEGERGVDQLNVNKFPVSKSFDDIVGVVNTLLQEDHPYQSLVIDSASALQAIIWRNICTANGKESIEDFGFGKGYKMAPSWWQTLLEGLDELRVQRNMAQIITGHVTTKEFNDPEADPYTTYEFDVHKDTAAMLLRWADVVLFANFERAVHVKVEGAGPKDRAKRATHTGKRVMYTAKRPAHPGKFRAMDGVTVPYQLPLKWSEMEKYYSPQPAAV